MKLKWHKVIELQNTYFEGNRKVFAYKLGIHVSQLFLFLDSGCGGGPRMIGGVMKICKAKNLNFEDYIEL